MLINASQVTNPSIDPLREPMETRMFLGRKPPKLEFAPDGSLKTQMPPQVRLSVPIMFSAMSFGSISANAHESLRVRRRSSASSITRAREASRSSSTSTGPTPSCRWPPAASACNPGYLNAGAMLEIKIGQGAKPGLRRAPAGRKGGRGGLQGTHDPGRQRRAVAFSAPRHLLHRGSAAVDILAEGSDGLQKPVCVKIAAVHNSAAIASGIARAGADVIAIDASGAARAPRRPARATTWESRSSWRSHRSTSGCATRVSATRYRWSWRAASAAAPTSSRR